MIKVFPWFYIFIYSVVCFADSLETSSLSATSASTNNSFYNDAFVVHKLSPSLYAIGEPNYYQANYSYLIVGEESALMFDSGANQEKDITKVIQSITDKPFAVIPSHLHFDHLGGIARFENIWLMDTPYIRSFKKNDGLFHIPESVHLGSIDGLVLPALKVKRLIQPNELIDLGGLQLKILATAGHCQDEIVVYDLSHNIMLTGDHLYPSWLLSGNLNDYIVSTDLIITQINHSTLLYGAHPDDDTTKIPAMVYSDAIDLQATLQGIKAGTAQGQAYKDSDLIESSTRYLVNKNISLLTDIKLIGGTSFSY